MSRAWSGTMHGVLQLADLTLAHVTQLSEASAAELLAKVGCCLVDCCVTCVRNVKWPCALCDSTMGRWS
jgi:hypothetical protein